MFSIAALGDKIVRDIRPGAAFEPTYIYRLLTVIKSSLSEKVWDRPNVARLECCRSPTRRLHVVCSVPARLCAVVWWVWRPGLGVEATTRMSLRSMVVIRATPCVMYCAPSTVVSSLHLYVIHAPVNKI